MRENRERQEVKWVAQNVHCSFNVTLQVHQFRHATAQNGEHENPSSGPVSNRFQNGFSVQPCHHSLQARDKRLPAVTCALIIGLVPVAPKDAV